MKFSLVATMGLLLTEQTAAFAPFTPVSGKHNTNNGRYMAMDIDMPPASPDVPVVQSSQYGPTDVRYSDFLKLVKADRVEKVTFSSDGSQLLGVDVDGTRIKIEALPNDPDLLSELTTHKVQIRTTKSGSAVFSVIEARVFLIFLCLLRIIRLMSPSYPSRKQAGLEILLKVLSSLPFCLLDYSF